MGFMYYKQLKMTDKEKDSGLCLESVRFHLQTGHG